MRKVKITKEQYDRIFRSGLLNEAAESKKDKPSYGGNDPIEKETKELISYFYRKSSDLSPFWEEHGLSYDEICKALQNKKLIVKKDDKFMIAKTLGSKEEAIDAIEKELRILAKLPEKEVPVEENDNAPAGSDSDPNNPQNQSDSEEPITNNTNYSLYVSNDDVAIFKYNKDNKFYLMDLDEVFVDHDTPNLQDEDIINFLNNNEAELDKYFIPLNEELINELGQMYNLNSFFMKKLEQIKALMSGITEDGGVNWAQTYRDINPEPKLRTGPENQAILDKIRALKQRSDMTHPKPVTKNPLDPHPDDIEETSAMGGSSGAFTPLFNAKQVNETTIADAGNFQYDTPGLVGISRDGKFSKNKGKTKAEKTPQWAGGGFVEQPKCSKLDNNKEAQNGGCNSGASSLKVKKASGSVNAPSLAENSIYEEVAKQTGRSIEEVKKIIESKKQ